MVLTDFEHLNLAQILRAILLEFLVNIRKEVYLELVYMFYSNPSFRENIIHSRVKNINIDTSLEEFARVLHFIVWGHRYLQSWFWWLWVSQRWDCFHRLLINLGLVKNEEGKYYTSLPKFSLRLYFSIYFQNRMSIAMFGVVLHFSSIAFWMAFVWVSWSFSLTSYYMSTSWFRVGISPTGWLLLTCSNISKSISPKRLPILFLLTMILLFWEDAIRYSHACLAPPF